MIEDNYTLRYLSFIDWHVIAPFADQIEIGIYHICETQTEIQIGKMQNAYQLAVL